MEQPYYEPESSVPSPYLKGIVNAKHKLQYFVHIFHSGISAITLNLDQKKKDALKVGDLLEVIVKYNQYAREGQNSRHIVLDYRRLETHSTVREITSDSIGAVVHLIARFQKRENYNLFYNELFGEIHDNFKHVPESAAHSGRPLLLEIVAKRLVKEKIHGLVCTKFLSFADAKGLDTRVVKKSASGLLLAFNGFSYSAWSPDYLNELRLGSRLISISDTDFLGRWFSFDSVQESADGSLRVDGKVGIREDVFPTRVKENVVEVEMRCEASGEKNGCALLKTDAGLVIDTDQLLKRPENHNHTFPKSWWFIPMLREQYSLKLSPNNFKRSIEVKVEYLDLNVEKEKEYNGLIMDVMPDGRSYVWCSEFDKDLLMYTKLIPESKPLGKWIKFSQYRKENDRFWILNPKLIDSVCPTRFNEKTNSLEIYINCISQEDDDYLVNPVYFSEDFGYVSDFDRIIDIDGPLPFDTWVVLIRETKESRCRFSISKSNNLDTSRSPKQTSSSDAKIDGLLRRDSAPLVRRVTPPPGFIPKRTTQSSSTAATAVLPPLKPKFADLMHLMPRNDDDGMYSSDDEDEMGGVRAFSTEAPRPVQMVSSSTASSVGDSDHELEMELPSTAAVGQKTHSVPFNASQYAGKSLREISLLILEDPALSRLIEEKNRRLYHAFANRVYNG